LALPELFVSVVIPVRDQAEELSRLLDALAHQTIPRDRFEVLIGDDGSRDEPTRHVSAADGCARVFSGPPRNAAAARNRAASAARAPVLAFTDAHCKPEPTWLEAGLRALEEADLVGGDVRSSVPARPSVWALLYMEALDQKRYVQEGYAMTANLYVRRDVFVRVGGFDESLRRGEDVDFVQRCTATGARLVFTADAVVEHPARQSTRLALRKIWANARWDATRKRRAGRRPTTRQGVASLPLFGRVLARRSLGLSLRIDRARLARYGLEPRLRDDLLAIPLIYLVVPFVRCCAGLYGWMAARRRP
jgi:glycosyltransferase involved in cell wall biosynthesis